MENKGINFAYIESGHSWRKSFECLVKSIEQVHGNLSELEDRTIVISFNPEKAGDYYYNENKVFDGRVGCRLTIKDLCAICYDLAVDPRDVEAIFEKEWVLINDAQPVFGKEGYQTNMSDLNGEELPDVNKLIIDKDIKLGDN